MLFAKIIIIIIIIGDWNEMMGAFKRCSFQKKNRKKEAEKRECEIDVDDMKNDNF